VRPGHSLHLCALVALVAFVAERPAKADDLSALQGILAEPIVSSASKRSEGASSAPALSTSLTAEDLRRYGIRTVAEAIDFLGIAVSTSENLSGGETGARGVLLTGDRGNHFLVMVDGYVVNDPLRGGSTFGVGAGIPIELVDHIEIIVGPGSVLYGSNAMFGLVNVVTKRAKDYEGVRVIAESALPISIRVGAGAGASFTAFGMPGEITTQIEYYKQEGPDLFFGTQNTGIDRFTGQPGRNTRDGGPTGLWGGARAENSLYAESPSGLLRVSMGNTELHLQGSYYRHGAPIGPGDFDDAETGEKETRGSLGLSHRIALSTLVDLSAHAYASYYRAESNFIASRGVLCPFGLVTCNYTDTGSGRWVGLEVQSTWDWFRNDRFVTVLGGDVRQRHVSTSSDTLDVETGESLYPAVPGLDDSDVIVAGYAQQTWEVVPEVKLSGGARIDSDPRFDPVATPRAAASFAPWSGGILKGSYSTAFRAPSWDETDNSTARRIKAGELLPEEVRSFELGLEQQFGPHRMVIGGFYSHWENLVELVPLSDEEAIQAIRNGETSVPFTPGIQLTQYRNSSRFRNYGMNTGFEGSVASGSVLYGFSVTGAVVKKAATAAGGTRLPVAPQIFGNARVAYVLGQDLPTIALATHVTGPRPADLSNGQFQPDPYARSQVQLRLTLSGNVPVLSGLSYRVMANYATASRGAYVVGPVTRAIPSQTTPSLVPVDRFRTTVGLQYAF
jgi:outer membrane receptor for ferrienterochelin and colicins